MMKIIQKATVLNITMREPAKAIATSDNVGGTIEIIVNTIL